MKWPAPCSRTGRPARPRAWPAARTRRTRRARSSAPGHRARSDTVRPSSCCDRVGAVQPRRQRADRDDVGRAGRAQRGPAAHRVPDQHDRDAGESPVQLAQCPLGVVQRVPRRAVPAAVAIAQQEHRRSVGRAASGRWAASAGRPARSVARALVAVGPPAVQHEHDCSRGGGLAADRFEAGQRRRCRTTAGTSREMNSLTGVRMIVAVTGGCDRSHTRGRARRSRARSSRSGAAARGEPSATWDDPHRIVRRTDDRSRPLTMWQKLRLTFSRRWRDSGFLVRAGHRRCSGRSRCSAPGSAGAAGSTCRAPGAPCWPSTTCRSPTRSSTWPSRSATAGCPGSWPSPSCGRCRWCVRCSVGGGHIPVYRDSAARAGDAYRDAIAAIQRGEIVVFYPEATYTADPDGWPMRAKNGIGRIALVTGAPVIPVANWGTQDVLPARLRAAPPVAAPAGDDRGRAAGGPVRLARRPAHPHRAGRGHRRDHGRRHRAGCRDPR